MALAANALTTIATVKDELAVTSAADDSYIERLINVYSGIIEQLCDRKFGRAVDWTEKKPAEGATHLVLERTPIEGIKSITYYGATIDPSVYEIDDATAGLVRFINSTYEANLGARNTTVDSLPGTSRLFYLVTYTGGYVLPKDEAAAVGETPAVVRTLPYDLEQACILGAVSAYRKRGRDRTVQSESLLGYSVTFARGGAGGDSLPIEAMAILQSYQRVIV